MTITFRQLEVFVAAAKDCNFRRTAAQLGISQPSISSLIRCLESHLGYNLFDRKHGAAPRLSTRGQQYLETAHEILQGKAGFGKRSVDAHDARAIQLTVMTGPLVLDSCIRPQLPRFCGEHPGINLEFVPLHPSRGPVQLMNSGDIDIAAYTGDPAEDWRVHSEAVNTVGCSIYASADLARRANQGATKLADLPWVMPPRNFAPAQFIWRFLRQAGVEPRNIVARSQFPDVAASMTLRGYAVAVLFDDLAAKGLAEGRIERIGPALPQTSRMLVVGPRAQRSACEPAVHLLRQAIKAPIAGLSP